MQFTNIVAFLSLITVAIAQGPPQCALSCLTSTPTNGCQPTDNACLCRNSAFIAAQSQCITSACPDPSDLQQAVAFAQANCLTVGVTLTATPTPIGTASSGSASPTSPSASGASSPTPSNAASTLSAPVALLAGVAACALAL